MNFKDIIVDNIFKQFDKLTSSFIDASSIIYLKNIDLLDCLSKNLKLFSITEILDETGYQDLPVVIYKHNIEEKLSNDEKLIECSISEKLPIITEDKKVINLAKKSKVEYYNSLMILNYLMYLDILSVKEYEKNYNKLINYAWYSDDVLEYGKYIYKEILIHKK